MGEKIIAHCSNITAFDVGKTAWNNPEIWQQYPGSGWISYLDQYAKREGFQLLSGLEALVEIKNKRIDPSDVYIVQEEENQIGLRLYMAQAKRAVLYCLESPLFVPIFYDILNLVRGEFPFQMLFGELGNIRAYFPSYDEEKDLQAPMPWEERKGLSVMVSSNKHYRSMLQNNDRLGLSETWDYALSHQLHDLRFQMIRHFRDEKKVMDLYGRGWADAPEIPAGQKIEVLRNYKYCFCIENVQMPGYVTEKIIDALVAGCVPIYVGAPDINTYLDDRVMVPIDPLLNDRLDPNQDPLSFCQDLDRSQKYLGECGGFRKFSYQSFARTVLDSVIKVMQS